MPIAENPRATVLLVDDDLTLAEMLRDQLTARGYHVYHAGSAAEAEAVVDEVVPDLVIVDLLLPDTHGLLLCANLRERITAPIIICTGSKRPEDPLLAFKLGADDFVLKPFSSEEFVARIEVAIRRPARGSASSAPSEVVQIIGPLVIDRTRCRVTLGGDPIHLTPTEYRLLCTLADRPNHVLCSKELGERVWGSHDPGIRRSLGSHLRRLRTKLKGGPVTAPALTAVRGFGYELAWEPADR
jgi:DNA-binding response OmpR family regulator